MISLAEGRSGFRITWGPPMYSAILGWFDAIRPGTTLYLAASLALLFGAWALLPTLRPRLFWTGPLLLALVVVVPQVMVYQGIVWKDVLFANLTVAAFVALAVAARVWRSGPSRALAFVIACLLLAVACLVRQNGFIAVAAAAVAVGWIGSRTGGARGALGWGLAGLALPLAIMAVLDSATPVRERPGVSDQDRGVRLVQQYDLAAALADDPAVALPHLERDNPAIVAVLRREAIKAYSPVRSDTLNASPGWGAVWRLDVDALSRQWIELIVSDPMGYAERRLEIFEWTFATPTIDKCLPVHLGVAGPPAEMARLKLAPRMNDEDKRLYNYVTWFLDTPAMSHVAYAAIALAVGLLLLIRRDPADIAIAGLMGAALAFAASFAVISLACDYRYLYLLDLAAITGLLYFALDPRLRRS